MSNKEITLIFPKNEFLIDPKVFPPLGILYLSSFLKSKDIGVHCIDMNLDDDLSGVDSEYIGISMTTPQRDEAYKILEHFKGRKTIAGGPHATHMGKECIEKGF